MTYLALKRIGKIMVGEEFRERTSSLLGLVGGRNR